MANELRERIAFKLRWQGIENDVITGILEVVDQYAPSRRAGRGNRREASR